MTVTFTGWLVVLASFCLAGWFLLQPWLRRRRLAAVAQEPVEAAAEQHLPAAIHCWARLTDSQRARLLQQARIFLHEKQFHGCGGLELKPYMRCVVAANACLLRLQPETDCYPALRHVLIYPTAFWARQQMPDELGLVSDDAQLLAGEAWDSGRVVLSWEDCEAAVHGAAHNVIVHEFAHQLDFEATGADGAPPLEDYSQWSRVFGREYARLQQQPPAVLDDYGSSNPAEFLAVAAEAFFQRGELLDAEHPELYELLSDYFQVRTAARR